MTGPTKVRDAVANLISASGGIYVDVTTIAGVIGDGVTNCVAALNTAFAAATDLTTFYFPSTADFYLCSGTTLLLKDNIILLGDGPEVSRIYNGTAASFKFPLVDTSASDNVEIRNLGFTYRGDNGSATAANCEVIKCQVGTRFRMDNCRITISAAQTTTLSGIAINTWYTPKSGAPSVVDYAITNCTFVGAANVVYIGANSVSNIFVSGNQIVASSTDCIGVAFYLCSQGIVSENISTGQFYLDDTTDTLIRGNHLSVDVNDGIELATDCSYISISGNDITAVSDYGISSNASSNSRITVNDNLISMATGAASIYLDASYSRVEGNYCNGPASGAGSQEGISLNAAHYSSVIGNTITGVANRAIALNGTKGCIVSENNCTDCSIGEDTNIYATGVTKCSFVGNVVNYTAVVTYSLYGVQLLGGASATNLVTNNVVVNFGTAAVAVNGGTSANNL